MQSSRRVTEAQHVNRLELFTPTSYNFRLKSITMLLLVLSHAWARSRLHLMPSTSHYVHTSRARPQKPRFCFRVLLTCLLQLVRSFRRPKSPISVQLYSASPLWGFVMGDVFTNPVGLASLTLLIHAKSCREYISAPDCLLRIPGLIWYYLRPI